MTNLRSIPMSSAATLVIDAASARDLPAIAALLRGADLPAEDIELHLSRFLVARDGDRVVGAIGAEVPGADALLRSFVVAPEFRGTGLGRRLLANLERSGTAWGVERWWLLTTTAQKFFAADGFTVVERCGAPGIIRNTGQFQGGTCRSAVCMTRVRRVQP